MDPIDYPSNMDDLVRRRFRCKPCADNDIFKGWHLRILKDDSIVASCMTCEEEQPISTIIGIVSRSRSKKDGKL